MSPAPNPAGWHRDDATVVWNWTDTAAAVDGVVAGAAVDGVAVAAGADRVVADTLRGGLHSDICHGGSGIDHATTCELTIGIPPEPPTAPVLSFAIDAIGSVLNDRRAARRAVAVAARATARAADV